MFQLVKPHTLGLVLFSGSLSLLSSSVAMAFNPQPDPPKAFGMIGVLPTETLRFNVVNVGRAERALPPDVCKIRLAFEDGQGNVISSSFVTIGPGQADFVDFTQVLSIPVPQLAQDRASSTARTELHPVLTAPPEPDSSCRPVATVEIIDNDTGRTEAILSAQVLR